MDKLLVTWIQHYSVYLAFQWNLFYSFLKSSLTPTCFHCICGWYISSKWVKLQLNNLGWRSKISWVDVYIVSSHMYKVVNIFVKSLWRDMMPASLDTILQKMWMWIARKNFLAFSSKGPIINIAPRLLCLFQVLRTIDIDLITQDHVCIPIYLDADHNGKNYWEHSSHIYLYDALSFYVRRTIRQGETIYKIYSLGIINS